MYGLVNQAIQDMICVNHGQEAWTNVRLRAEVAVDHFEGMEPYPDDLTHRLVMAASVELGESPHALLRAFGEFWVTYTAAQGYGPLMEMAGSNLPEFLRNLDDLHARVGVNFPQLVPPSFDTEEPEEGTMHLHYHSQRQGLAPMVIGLVEGLGDRFATPVQVEQLAWRSEGADHDVFAVRYEDQADQP
ncbi:MULTISPECIES: heme NO-binding domain-containing protein [unclassified Cyanobium]|uniref:heme NO-binding domain-containing protein n=1 Tax=unclassified Cyanobium TaxID=2627006 RepID=UPI0020CE408C|nr:MULTISPECIES: heme NO-binding domain-containing protein [unclassified Cyanobium]MCP9777654.1 heme NO-binding domain-containing protein [Cyanobium sp. Tous-M-B4]MCP9877731.1 heme NO-binding domain-containing protein [Cyanobium sp. A2C-AMD]